MRTRLISRLQWSVLLPGVLACLTIGAHAAGRPAQGPGRAVGSDARLAPALEVTAANATGDAADVLAATDSLERVLRARRLL